ncbi:MAG TPA: SlyX family protein [Candidatus Limnocylindria bacterium]|jgi:uncharacterized coiled-coil protein SlyX|nr:SlyX family protein [Candidatus Limnocylindria bacterium]
MNPAEHERELVARLETLEASHAHLERQYDELNGAVIEQGRLISRLQKRLEQLDTTLQSQELERLGNATQKPPHYAP